MKTISQINRVYLAFAMSLSLPTHAAEPGRLEGFVMDLNRNPMSNASIFVHTARPRESEPTMCPDCYPDCGKHVRTDADGRFVIESVNPDLFYRLLVVAKGFRPDYIKDADPLFGSSAIKLKLPKWPDATPDRRVTGKIIDPEGRPVRGAVLDVKGVRYGRTSSYDAGGRAESLGATDENGAFSVAVTNGMEAITVTVEARGLAKRRMWLDASKTNLIRLERGVNLTGRLLYDGKPISGLALTMNTQEREASVFMRGFDSATDADGRFVFPNVPASKFFYIHTPMKDIENMSLAMASQLVSTGPDGTTTNLGDIKLLPTLSLRGQVVMSDGGRVPDNTQIFLGLIYGYGYQQVLVAPNGHFKFDGLPANSLSLQIRAPGYEVSAKNPSKDWLSDRMLVGRLESDLDNFLIHLEPEEKNGREQEPKESSDRHPIEKPLRSASP